MSVYGLVGEPVVRCWRAAATGRRMGCTMIPRLLLRSLRDRPAD
ncbi:MULTISPECIES: hypothetical protein [unclassified Streptomyces]|nr:MULTISPECIES: hypothetical protein [unclassified Streptomyces]